MKIDLLIENARVWTGDSYRPEASSIGVLNGRIVGLDEDLHGVKPAETLDAKGAFVTPGFNDSHSHSVWFGQTLLELNLFGVKTGTEILSKVREYASKNQQQEWVIASNFNPLAIRDIPARDELDEATNGRPLWIKHASGHAYTLNGVGLKAVNIADYPTSQPEGGKIVTDDSGRATGLIEENAMQIVQEVLMPDSLEDIVEALDVATKQYLREGLTSVTDAGIAGGWIGHSPKELGAYIEAFERGSLHTRMQPMITIDALHTVAGHESEEVAYTLDTGLRTGLGNEWLQVGPVKVFTDGSLLGATAAMEEEYAHCPGNHGYLLGDPDEMRKNVLAAASAGWSLALHAIGDAAVEYSIGVIQEAQKRYGQPRIPHRIEHGGVVHDEQIERLAASRIALVPQPNFITEFGEGLIRNLGEGRVDKSYPAKRLLDAGAILPGSSDRPVAPGAPLHVMQAFVERLTETGRLYGKADRITAAQALHAYTQGSAEATGWEKEKGILAPGFLADLTFLSESPMLVNSNEISQIEVLKTVVGGKVSEF